MKYTRSLLFTLNKVSLVAIAAIAIAATSVQADVIVSDNFDDALAGNPLAGRLPSTVGFTAWQNWNDGQKANTLNGAVSLTATSSVEGAPTAGGYIAVPTYTTPLISVSADIKLGLNASAWAGVNFTGDGNSPFGSVFAFFSTDGSIAVFTNAAGSLITTSQIANFNISTTYKLELQFNYAAQTLNVLVDNTALITDRTVLINNAGQAVGGVIQPVTGAGFFAGGPTYPNGSLDNFLVQTAVPEPSSVALLIAGGSILFALARARRKLMA